MYLSIPFLCIYLYMYINDLHLSVYSLQPLFLYFHFLLAPTPSLSLSHLSPPLL